MSAVQPDFQQIVELASQLSPEQQLRLVVRIGENLTSVLSEKGATRFPRGSAAAVLEAMRKPPHLSDADLEELRRAIASGRQPAQAKGVFDGTDDS